MSLDELREEIKTKMSDFRYEHTLGVERAVVILSKLCAKDCKDDLRKAALLHDITKEVSFENQLIICQKYRYRLSDDDVKSSKTLHQITGAVVAKNEYKLSHEMCDAIAFHSTAKPDMNIFSKILYLADYIEDTRKYPMCIEIRNKFFNEINKSSALDYISIIDKTILKTLRITINELKKDKSFIHPNTIMALKFLENQYND